MIIVKVLVMSASANKLSKFKQHAPTYASLIMEELDPDQKGYIEVRRLDHLINFLFHYNVLVVSL